MADPVLRRQQLQPNRSYSRDSAEVRIAGQYELQHTIGRGHFAVVKLARHVFTGEQVAVKVIDKAKLDSSNRESLYQEVMCMKLVQHPNVVRLYDVIDTPNKLYLILELGDGGDLYDFIIRQDGNCGLRESLAKSFFHQIVTAIAYCHRLHVCHRDLKLENCVVFERQGLVKLTDFGFSNVFTPGKYLETSCGSLAYSAPEILLGDSYDATKVDVWSLGVILFMLVSGRLPFQEPNDSETLARIMDVRYKAPKHVSSTCRCLINRLLQRDPTKRPSLDGILTDDWFSDVQHSVYDERPLISLGRISPADQQEVIDKMVDGGLATQQEIMDALERDDYSYITSTFYLLAERLIKRSLASPAAGPKQFQLLQQQQQQQAHRKTSDPSSSSGSSSSSELQSAGNNNNNSSRQSSSASLSVEERLRRFSMIIEEEDDEFAAAAALDEAAASGIAGGPGVRSPSSSSASVAALRSVVAAAPGRLSSLSGLAALCDPIREEETGEGGVLQLPAPPPQPPGSSTSSQRRRSGTGSGAAATTAATAAAAASARESNFSLSSLASSLRSLSSQRPVVDLIRDLSPASSSGGGGGGNKVAAASSRSISAATAPVASAEEEDSDVEEDNDSSEENSSSNSEDNDGDKPDGAAANSRRRYAGHVNQCVTLSCEDIRVSDSCSTTTNNSNSNCAPSRSDSQQQQRQQQQRQKQQRRHRPKKPRLFQQYHVRQQQQQQHQQQQPHCHRHHQRHSPALPASSSSNSSSVLPPAALSAAGASATASAATGGGGRSRKKSGASAVDKFRVRCCAIS